MNPSFKLSNPETDIYIGDCRQVLSDRRFQQLDLVFMDPPFNWKIDYGLYKDNLSRMSFLSLCHQSITWSVNSMRDGGALWVNIPDDSVAELVMYCKSIGLRMMNWCIWHYRFGQCTKSRFINSKVHVLYFVKGNIKKRTWNPEEIMEKSDRVKYKDKRTLESKTPGRRVPFDVWYGQGFNRIQGNNKERRPGHPNQLPEAYLERVIRSCSNPGDVVLDPFLGSGTTLTVARALARRGIGIELDEK